MDLERLEAAKYHLGFYRVLPCLKPCFYDKLISAIKNVEGRGYMTTYGYQRVSTTGQRLARQTKELLEQGIEAVNIYTDKDSGGKVHRDGLDKLLSIVEPGDKVVVMSFDRLARSVSQLLTISEDFQERGIELVSIKEQIDTSTATGKLFFTISAAFAQFEKDINNERTKQGLAVVKAKGVKLGRPSVPKEKLDEAVRLYKQGNMTMKQISSAVHISPSPIYRELRRLNITR